MRFLVIVGALLISGTAKAEHCHASYYSHGTRTASGERFDPRKLTAAHRTRSFGSWVSVTNKRNGRAVRVRITDRGPFIRGRCIDLSYAAAQAIGMGGTAPVEIR